MKDYNWTPSWIISHFSLFLDIFTGVGFLGIEWRLYYCVRFQRIWVMWKQVTVEGGGLLHQFLLKNVSWGSVRLL